MLKHSSRILFVFVIIFSMFTSCSKDQGDLIESSDDRLIDRKEIQKLVEDQLSKGSIFYWKDQSIDVLYSAGMLSDSIFSIGYTTFSGFDIEKNIHLIDLTSSQWKGAKSKVEDIILSNERAVRGSDISMRDLEPFGQVDNFPQIIIQTNNKDLLNELRRSDNVRFVEPLGFNISDFLVSERSSSGCSGTPDYNININDYTTVTPTAKVPWNFYNHNIDDAWDASSKGNNVKLCIIDTGASDSQDNLGSNFNSGNSYGRTIEKYSTKYSGSWWWKTKDSPNDPCGHGTSMAGLGAAPWSNDGNSIGVAYQCDLMTIRAVEDVLISTSNERKGVRDALYLAGNSSVKVISMSIGTPFYSSTVADGIYYAYNHQKLMFAAAGTSLPWSSWAPVIFPANMSQTRAVTGIKDGSGSMTKCETCHSGSEVDFVIIMERSSNTDRHSLSLALYSNQPKYIGGSSCATATTAGIATMVWAKNPSASRYSVVNALKNASNFYPYRDSDFGWGKIDAMDAFNNL